MSTHTDNITRCPQCSTAFRVTSEVLQVANGAVRCGSCLRVFNAQEHLLHNDTEETSESDTNTHANHSNTNTEASSSHSIDLSADDHSTDESWALELLKESEMEENARQTGNFTAPFAHHQENNPKTSLTPIDSNNEAITKAIAENIQERNQEENKKKNQESHNNDDDPTDTLFIDIINNDLQSNDDTTKNNNIPNDALEISSQPNYNKQIDEEDENWAEDLLVDENSEPNAVFIPTTASTSNKTILTNDRSPPSFDFEPDDLHFTEEKPHRRQWPWAIASLLLIISLFAQLAWFKFNEFSTLPTYRPYYAMACNILHCQLPDIADITQIRSTHLVIRSHPDKKNALIVDAIIANAAAFEQPFPAIRLVFLDIQGNTVASRAFQPKEYVKGELFGASMMPAQQSIQLSLSIIDPGDKAVNYRLEMIPATAKD